MYSVLHHRYRLQYNQLSLTPKPKARSTNHIHNHPHPTIMNNHVNITNQLKNNNNHHITTHSINKHSTPHTKNQTTNPKTQQLQQPTHTTYQTQQQPYLCPPHNYTPILHPNFDYSNTIKHPSTSNKSYYYIATIEPSNSNPTSFTQLSPDFPPNMDFENFNTFKKKF